MSTILDPNINPMDVKMDQSARSIAFMRLKNQMPHASEKLGRHASDLTAKFKNMYTDGPEETFDKYDQFVTEYRKAMAAAESLFSEIRNFEKAYLTWMAQVKGEDKVVKLLETLK